MRHLEYLGSGRRRMGIFIAGGVCFHRGSWSGDSASPRAEALCLVVLVNWRVAWGLAVLRRVRAQLAHMKDGREADIVCRVDGSEDVTFRKMEHELSGLEQG